MATIIFVSDLPSKIQTDEMAQIMVDGANAKASRVAPCLSWDGTDPLKPVPTDDQLNEARLVLIGAVKRWAESGAGSFQTQSAGPFSMGLDTRQKTGYNLWPSEIESLQAICKAIGEGSRQAFSISTVQASTIHADWCALNFGATYCSCGADIAGYPIFEQA